MVKKLKKFQIGDLVYTRGDRWKTPFVVEVIYGGFIVAVNRKSPLFPQFLFIKPYSNEVYSGSSRFQKYGVDTKSSIIPFIQSIHKGEYVLDKDTCYPTDMILGDDCFEQYERREQVRYE